MKKLFTLLLVLACCIGTANADWYVAGSSAIANGEDWVTDAAKNKMTLAGGNNYYLVVEGATLAANTEYKFKVCNGSWGTAYPSKDWTMKVAEAGTYTLIYTFSDSGDHPVNIIPIKDLYLGNNNGDYDKWDAAAAADGTYKFTKTDDKLNWYLDFDANDLSNEFYFRIYNDGIFSWDNPANAKIHPSVANTPIAIATPSNADMNNVSESWKFNKPSYDFNKLRISAEYDLDNLKWTVTADAYITVSVSDAGYATFSYACPLDLTEVTGFEAYVASGIGDDNGSKYVQMNKVTGAVPAETGLLLVKEGGCTNVEVPVAASAVAPTNLLVATVTETTVDASTKGAYHYFLAKGANGIGFYNLASSATSGANKAYLSTTTELTSGSTPSKVAWTFNEDESSEVDAVNHLKIPFVENNAPMYNLAGQRVNNDYKGVVVKNGKKFINK